MNYWISKDQLKELANAENGNQIFVLCHKIAKEQKLETARTESMNKGLAQTLVDFYSYYHGEPLHLQSLPLTKNQYNNFQKLQYHGLVSHGKVGYWDITPLGREFLEGKSISKSVTVDNGVTTEYSSSKTTLEKLLGSYPAHLYPQQDNYYC